MQYNIFLDDVRRPKDVTWVEIPLYAWDIVRNYKQFVELIEKNGMPNFVCYDHDLEADIMEGDPMKPLTCTIITAKTGYDCAKWLVDYCSKKGIKHPKYVVHSFNPIGAENIRRYIESYNRSVK